MKKSARFRLQERIITLARVRGAGSPADLAIKLDSTERTIKRTVKEIRDQGIPIYFDHRSGSYRID
ncbi:MAG: HTH domain-containing protein [Bacteroidales bacterium]|nr:HTH domain-containing protein [Bacteroidales bacterium]